MRAGPRSVPIAAAGLLLVSCAADDIRCGDACGSLIIDFNTPPTTTLPIAVRSIPDVVVSNLIYLSLADIGIDQNVVGDVGFEPRLAKSWTFEDSVTIAFNLDERAHWQDGTPVTAADVAFTYDLFTDTTISPSYTELRDVAAVEIRDDRTVAFRFRRAYGEQFYDVTFHLPVMPAHLLDSIPRENLADHPLARAPIGNGPYRVTRWDAPNAVELEADTTFFLGRPGIARILMQTVQDRATSVTRLTAGETDFVEFLGGPPEIERVTNAEAARVLFVPAPVYFYIAFNFRDASGGPHPIFTDRNVRRAMALALDRNAIVQSTLGPQSHVPFGPVTSANPLWTLDIEHIPFDTAAANALLDEAGWRDTDADGYRTRDGRRLSFELLVPPGVRGPMSVIVESQWAAVGIEARLVTPDFSAYTAGHSSGAFEAVFGGWGQSPKILGAIRAAWASDGPLNYGRWSNAEFDSLLDDIDRTTDLEAKRVLWAEAFRRLQEEVPAVWMANPAQAAGVSARFDNVTLRPDSWGATIWQWSVPRNRMIPRDQIALH